MSSSDGGGDALEQLLDGVWTRRRAELVERSAALQALLDGAVARDAGAWTELAAQAHRMVGALGALGFEQLALDLRQVEVAVDAHPLPDATVLAAAATPVRQLGAVLAATEARPRA